MSNPGSGPASQLYASLVQDRQPFLTRARRIALLTKPSLFRPEGSNGTTDTAVAWQNLGAYAVNNLASKIVLALFPPGLPSFKYNISRKVLVQFLQLQAGDRGAAIAELQRGLEEAEKEAQTEIEADGDRAILSQGIVASIVGGNPGFQIYRNSAKMRYIPLDNFVLVRDKAGNVLEFCVQDGMAWQTLPETIQDSLKAAGYNEPTNNTRPNIDVYTHGKRQNDGSWVQYQEAWGIEVDGSRITHATEDDLEFFFPPWNLLNGESYGRSYCEDFEGDLQSLDGYEQIISEGSMAAAKFLTLIRPGGTTKKDLYAKAPNGAVISGVEADVHVVTANKNADFRTAQERIQALSERISRTFLLNSSVQRDAERVTRAEIMEVSQELEDQLGGVYSNMAVFFQNPYLRKKLKTLGRLRRIAKLPEGATYLSLTTGSTALGRQAEINPMIQLFTAIAQIFGPETIQQYIDRTIAIKRLATAYGVSQDGLVKTQEQIDQEMQAQQQQMMQAQLAPEVVKAGGKYITDTNVAQIKQGETPPQPGQPA